MARIKDFKKTIFSRETEILSLTVPRDYRNNVVAFPLNNHGVQAAIDKVNAMGQGTVVFTNYPYKMRSPAVMKDGVSYYVDRPTIKSRTDIPDSGMYIYSGFRFVNDPGVYSLVHNHEDATELPPLNTLADNALCNISIVNLISTGGAGLIKSGANKRIGLLRCRLDNLYAFDSTDWALNLSNFQQCTFGDITLRNAVPGGGIRFATQMDRRNPGDANTLLLPGNSTVFGRIFIFNSHIASRGIEIYSGRGDQMNQLNFEGALQVNRFHGSNTAYTISLGFNATSADISVPPADYDKMVVGGIMSWNGAVPNWYDANLSHYVVSKNDANKTIQIADTMYGAGKVSSATGNFTVKYGGYPALAIVGFGGAGGSLNTNCSIRWADFEIQGNAGTIYAASTRGFTIGLSESYVSTAKSSIIVRFGTLKVSTTKMLGIGLCEVDSNSILAIVNENPGSKGATTGRTLNADDHERTTVANITANADFVVPPNMPHSYTHKVYVPLDVPTATVGFIQGSGVTINPPNLRTSGPGKTLKLKFKSNNVYEAIEVIE